MEEERKIFISHQSGDKDVADMLLHFLKGVGVRPETVFCSSLPGNDAKEEIFPDVKKNLKNSALNIAILSDSYYKSAYCMNEAGIIWYCEQTPMFLVGLPEIAPNKMQGFLDQGYKLRRLDTIEDIAALYDMVKECGLAEEGKTAIFLNESEALQQCYRKYINDQKSVEITEQKQIMSEYPQGISLISYIMGEDSIDDEKIVAYYVFSEKMRRVNIKRLEAWIGKEEVKIKNLDHACDMLAVMGHGKYNGELLELEENEFREGVYCGEGLTDGLKQVVLSHKNLSRDRFCKMMDQNMFDEGKLLLFAYLIDEKRSVLGVGFEAPEEIKHMKMWQDRSAPYAVFSEKYGELVNYLCRNKMVYTSDWTKQGEELGYALCPSLEKILFQELPMEYRKKIDMAVESAHNPFSYF